MLNEELNKIKYLFGYQKGVVISEQVIPPPTTSGTTGAIPPPPADAGAIPPPPADAGAIPPPPADAGAIPPPPADAGAIPPPPPMGNVTTQTTTVPQKVDIDKLRDCAGYKSGGKLTKGEEKDDFTLFNNEKGIAVCKKPK